MKLHEYQARDLLARHGVAVTGGRVAATPAEARAIAQELGGKVVVKAQIHAGGRGKGRLVAQSETQSMFHSLSTDAPNNSGQVRGGRVGGVRLADSPAEAEAAAAAILGKHLVSIQTGPEGKLVKHVLVAEQSDIAKEYYLAILVDGAQGGHLLMASAEGGQEIEVVARNNPELIVRMAVNPVAGFEPYVGRVLAARLGLEADQAVQFAKLAESLYEAAVATDASLVEINPVAVTAGGRVVALDAKLTIDDNALYRHKDLEALRDKDEEDPLEVMAQELGVANFIKLEG
ncbi:MAG: ATP-grasp domain-containing protein, partial [Tepidiformaceae bacterium]